MSGNALDQLLQNKPKFHGSAENPKSWKSQEGVLRFFDQTMSPELSSLETGCGYSTVVFASRGGQHTTVTPAKDETTRVLEYCHANGIDTSALKFAVGKSFEVLPGLVDDGPLHLVYVDGSHGFPHPCVDWMYTEMRLEIGGWMLVDDVRIPTCRMLHDFLAAEDNYRLEQCIGDTSVFRKLAHDTANGAWGKQGYNRSYPDFSFLPLGQRIANRVRRMIGR